MRYHTPVSVLCALVAMTGLTACGGDNPGLPSPDSTSATGPSSSNQAPKVDHPLTDTASAEADPCSLIPVGEIEAIGGKVKRSSPQDTGLGKACSWVFDGGFGTAGGGFVTANKDGISSLYKNHDLGLLTTFKPQPPIDGYPTVIYANGGEGPGFCAVAVGVRDDMTYTVDTQLRTGHPSLADPCAMATKIATAALAHLKAS